MGFGGRIGLRHSVRPVSRGKILWVLYRKNKAPNDPSYDLLCFRREVAEVILEKFSRNSSRTSNRTNTISRNVCNEIRYDQMGHFSEPCATTKRCALCKKTRVDGVRSVERALMIAALIIAFMAFRLGAFSFDIFVRSKSGCRFEQQVDF